MSTLFKNHSYPKFNIVFQFDSYHRNDHKLPEVGYLIMRDSKQIGHFSLNLQIYKEYCTQKRTAQEWEIADEKRTFAGSMFFNPTTWNLILELQDALLAECSTWDLSLDSVDTFNEFASTEKFLENLSVQADSLLQPQINFSLNDKHINIQS